MKGLNCAFCMADHSRVIVLMLDSFSIHHVLPGLLKPWRSARTLEQKEEHKQLGLISLLWMSM